MRQKVRHISVLALLIALTVSVAHAETFDHTVWDKLLSKHVSLAKNGSSSVVDYSGFKADQIELQTYLSALGSVDKNQFDAWEKSTRLAFLINAYNAWTVERILERYPDLDSIKDLGSFLRSPWSKPVAPLLGETRSLDNIEHDLIRGSGQFNEPRIHFAVNCASIGCPALLPNAFTDEALDAQLEFATRAFLSDNSRNRYRGGKLQVSSIFKWYREDFEIGPDGTLNKFLSDYSSELGVPAGKALDADVIFLPYDWALNSNK